MFEFFAAAAGTGRIAARFCRAAGLGPGQHLNLRHKGEAMMKKGLVPLAQVIEFHGGSGDVMDPVLGASPIAEGENIAGPALGSQPVFFGFPECLHGGKIH